MVANLQQAGYRVVVNDVNRAATASHVEAGAVWADTPRAVAEQSEIIFSCLPSLQAIESVALGESGVCAGIRRGSAFFEMSTSTLELVKRLHAAFAERGANMLDAPISGGARGAKSKRLAIWVGGDKAVFQRYEPVLKAMADHPDHVGDVGTGLVTKLVHNCAMQSTQAAIAACRAALEEHRRAGTPLEIAMTCHALGEALKLSGEREKNPEHLVDAIQLFEEAKNAPEFAAIPGYKNTVQNSLWAALAAKDEMAGSAAPEKE